VSSASIGPDASRPDEAASEVVGSILMVALTVAIAAAMGTALYGSIDDEEPARRASFTAELRANDGGWGTGDETVRVAHKGGYELDAGQLAITIEVDGAESRYATGSSPLDHAGQDAFSTGDEVFTIGERWSSSDLTVPARGAVSVAIVDTAAGSVVWSTTLRAGPGDGSTPCDPDTQPPSVQGWAQDPIDVDVDTSGPVTVSATLQDDCSVDTTHDPHLHFRIDDGTDPAFTDDGAMTLQTGTTWEADIPDQTWSNHGGDTLEYKIVDMRDETGNSAESDVRRDPIEACPSDATAPTVDSWTQDPSDVRTNTTRAVTVSATLGDDCSGVDTTHDPHLFYRVNDGTDPAFTDDGEMLHQTGTTWEADIPDRSWSTHQNDTLEYKLVDMRDEAGNAGDSTVQQDVIQSTGSTTTTPVAAFTVVEGSASTDPESSAASDDGDEANFTERSTSTQSTSFTLDADGSRDSSNTWTNEANGFSSDDQYASTQATNPIRYTMNSPQTIDTVSSVILRAEVSITSHNNDAFTLAACFPSGACGTASNQVGASGSDVNVQYDVTPSGRHPLGNASWTQSDLDALELRITPVQNTGSGPPQDGTWRVDRAWTSVSGSTGSGYSLEVQGDVSTVPAGTHSLEMEYRVDGDNYDVQVYDWTNDAWNTRGSTLDQTTATAWTYALTSDEYDDANDRVRMRYLDTTTGVTEGQLFVDYLHVVTS
jgi:flagellin-like protein